MAGKSKIAVITPSKFPGTAGDSANYSEIINQLVSEGYDIYLICPKLPKLSNDVDKNLNYKVLRVPISPPRLDQVSKGLKARHWLQLVAFLIAETSTVLSVLLRNRIRSVYVRHGLLTLQLPVLLKLLQVKAIADGELFTDSLIGIRGNNIFKNLLRRYENRAIKFYDYFKVSTSTQGRNIANIGFPQKRVLFVPMSVNIDKVPRFPLEQIPEHTFGYFGALETWQGIDVLIDSFVLLLKNLPNAILYLIGDGSLRHSIEKRITEEKINQNVFLVGSLPRELLWKEYFGKFRILVLPRPKLNNSIDTLPSIKLIEAMASGKPVITSDIPVMREEPSGSMMLVKPGDPRVLADAMEQLSKDEMLLRNYSELALNCAQRHDIRKNINKLAAVLEA